MQPLAPHYGVTPRPFLRIPESQPYLCNSLFLRQIVILSSLVAPLCNVICLFSADFNGLKGTADILSMLVDSQLDHDLIGKRASVNTNERTN